VSARRGRGWAYVGLLLGGAASVAGNVTHAVLTPNTHSLALRVVAAVFWPVAVLAAVEILARPPWRRTVWHWLTRVVLIGGVALVAAAVSFDALRALLISIGYRPEVATAGPLAIDGMMVGSTVALLLTMAHDAAPRAPRVPLAQRVAQARASAMAVRDAATGDAPRADDTAPPDATRATVARDTAPRATRTRASAPAVAIDPAMSVTDVMAATGLARRSAQRHLARARVIAGNGHVPDSTSQV
jgi:hypothetical protein